MSIHDSNVFAYDLEDDTLAYSDKLVFFSALFIFFALVFGLDLYRETVSVLLNTSLPVAILFAIMSIVYIGVAIFEQSRWKKQG